ncbi:hypothetical protein [Salinicola halimionae]|uniref:hypothetical protein n=1 Tax=Salinicola halimionae TaxID=1949081 RepID=UPI000DA1B52B|nr:hypothetical protein [Salinicola halimionae]
MEQWLNSTLEGIVLCLGLCSLALIYRSVSRTAILAIVAIAWASWIEWPVTSVNLDLMVAFSMLLMLFVLTFELRLPAWLATSMSPAGERGTEAAVQVATHPVSGKLQVFHLSRWFEAVLIDPANPPLRDGETVYLIRWEARRAWVSRVRSHTPAPKPSKGTHRRWQWSVD